jgi:hypothetical protein
VKFQFKITDEKRLKDLGENQLTFLYEFFHEKTVFQCSQTEFLAFLSPHTIKSYEHSRVLLCGYNKGNTLNIFESSISVGLIHASHISRIKHAPPFTVAVPARELICVEFPLKGDNTPKGKYRINITVKESGKKIKQLAEKFSICFLSDFVTDVTQTGVPGRVLAKWALSKWKNKKMQVSTVDGLYLGSSLGIECAVEGIKKEIAAEGIRGHATGALAGAADGFFAELFDTTSPTLTLTVV